MRSRLVLVVAVVAAAVLASVAAGSSGPRKLTVMLDWTPNPDHVGLFVARDTGLFAKAGLDVAIQAPSDPTSPLKLVALGRTDLAVSYEQDVFLAAEKKLPIEAVAAVVPRPLNSIMAISPGIRSVRDLKGKTVGITGVPADYAALDTALESAGLSQSDVHVVHVGYNLLPALLSHKVDAVLGVYRNVEGIELQQRGFHPTVIPLDRAGIPTYDELVLVASTKRIASDPVYADAVRKFVAAFVQGTSDARAHPAQAEAILRKETASPAKFLAKATPATLALLSTPNGPGCMSRAAWARFDAWMHARKLLTAAVPASAAMTTRFLPARCRA